MVQYWKNGDMARAKLVVLKDGSYAMMIEGEKHPLYGFPRGPVLFGPLAGLKKMVKQILFNKAWELLEEGKKDEEVLSYIKSVALPIILRETSRMRYDMFPPERLCPMAREIWRAMSKVGGPEWLKEAVTFFLQEDDAYRFRLQWASPYINPRNLLRRIYRFITGKPYSLIGEVETILGFLENAEITPDMKGRARLIKRVMSLIMKDKELGGLIENVIWEIDWKKLKLMKADAYYFRGKYFKVDYAVYDY